MQQLKLSRAVGILLLASMVTPLAALAGPKDKAASKAEPAEEIEVLNPDPPKKRKSVEPASTDSPPVTSSQASASVSASESAPSLSELMPNDAAKNDASKQKHGSQASFSEWLSILVGAGVGVALGVLTGRVVDDTANKWFGSFGGLAIGGVFGGASGAWIIRAARDEDTRWAGAFAGGALGLGAGVIMFSKLEWKDRKGDVRVENVLGKIAALLFTPAIGIFAGRRIAYALDHRKENLDGSKVVSVNKVRVAPLAEPVVTQVGAQTRTTGASFGLQGQF